MNRIQKKCFLASAGFHLLLLLILLVGPAFLTSNEKTESLPVLDFVPVVTTDAMASGGGNRNAKPPPPAPEPPAPQPPAAPPEPEEPPKPVAKEIAPSPDALEPSSDKKSHKVQVSKTEVTRKQNPNAKSSNPTTANATPLADARRLGKAFSNALRDLRTGLSSGTEIELPGPGGGGLPYANFRQAVQSVYARAWQGRVPDGTTDKDTDALASVTIARDGTVVSWTVTRASGNAGVDRAVREVLDYVKYAAPLPEDSADDQRTVTIKFKVNTGQMAG